MRLVTIGDYRIGPNAVSRTPLCTSERRSQADQNAGQRSCRAIKASDTHPRGRRPCPTRQPPGRRPASTKGTPLPGRPDVRIGPPQSHTRTAARGGAKRPPTGVAPTEPPIHQPPAGKALKPDAAPRARSASLGHRPARDRRKRPVTMDAARRRPPAARASVTAPPETDERGRSNGMRIKAGEHGRLRGSSATSQGAARSPTKSCAHFSGLAGGTGGVRSANTPDPHGYRSAS